MSNTTIIFATSTLLAMHVGSLAVIFDVGSDASSPSLPVTFLAPHFQSHARTRSRSCDVSKVFRRGAVALSAFAVLAADPDKRSPKASTTVITPFTALRCCRAAKKRRYYCV